METQQQPPQAPPARPVNTRPAIDVAAVANRGRDAVKGASEFLKEHGPTVETGHRVLRTGAKFAYKLFVGSFLAVKGGIQDAQAELTPKRDDRRDEPEL